MNDDKAESLIPLLLQVNKLYHPFIINYNIPIIPYILPFNS